MRVDAVMDIVEEQMSRSERPDHTSRMRKPRSSFVVKAEKRKATLREDSSLMFQPPETLVERK